MRIIALSACTLLPSVGPFSHAQATSRAHKETMSATQNPVVVHNSAIVIDTHADTPQRFVDEHWNFTDPLNGGFLRNRVAAAFEIARGGESIEAVLDLEPAGQPRSKLRRLPRPRRSLAAQRLHRNPRRRIPSVCR